MTQSGACNVCNVEVVGSSPIISTMDNKRIQEMYDEGVITQKEMFGLWRSYGFEPTAVFQEEYFEWLETIKHGSITACIRA